MPRLTIAVVLLMVAATATAGEVVRWVDSEGVTHFSEPYLAESEATPVTLAPTNGMDVPAASKSRSKQRSATFKKISKAGKKNKDGWTGYNRNKRSQQRRRYR